MHRFSAFRLLHPGARERVKLVENPAKQGEPLTLYLQGFLHACNRDVNTKVATCTISTSRNAQLALINDWISHHGCDRRPKSTDVVTAVGVQIPYKCIRIRGLTTYKLDEGNSIAMLHEKPMPIFIKAFVAADTLTSSVTFVCRSPGTKGANGKPLLHWISQRKTCAKPFAAPHQVPELIVDPTWKPAPPTVVGLPPPPLFTLEELDAGEGEWEWPDSDAGDERERDEPDEPSTKRQKTASAEDPHAAAAAAAAAAVAAMMPPAQDSTPPLPDSPGVDVWSPGLVWSPAKATESGEETMPTLTL